MSKRARERLYSRLWSKGEEPEDDQNEDEDDEHQTGDDSDGV